MTGLRSKLLIRNKLSNLVKIKINEIRWKGKCSYIHNLVKYEFDL